ncbi:hypothetical protein E0H73_37745 [Kribbella pittospori]|uniref:Uncharacterized protein n=1 Tax=Kribbella pittospori TaxID=722689 RepID=A0A4R0KH78_9ACTN|nr:hypothetical protein [Kribbella pittospori]TCC54945.1 hypothetical protein E0H73_37745 [Kribbella pittospori]
MATYRRLWLASCLLCAAPGVVYGAILIPVELLIPLVLLAATACVTLPIDREIRDSGLEPRRAGHWLRVATVACGTWLAVLGLGQILNVAFFLLVLAFWATSPGALRWYGERFRPAVVGDDEYTMSTAQLCRQWQASYAALQQAGTPSVHLQIAAARQRCLDELERRDPGGFSAWLASAASAGGNPRGFIEDEASDSRGPDT